MAQALLLGHFNPKQPAGQKRVPDPGKPKWTGRKTSQHNSLRPAAAKTQKNAYFLSSEAPLRAHMLSRGSPRPQRPGRGAGGAPPV